MEHAVTPSSENIKIQVENLSIRYGISYAVKSVSLDIVSQAVTALIGPSGGANLAGALRLASERTCLPPSSLRSSAGRSA